MCLGVFGCVYEFGCGWRYLNMFGGVWRCLEVFRDVWTCLELFGGVWNGLEVFWICYRICLDISTSFDAI